MRVRGGGALTADGQVLFDGMIKGRKGTVVFRETGNTAGGDVHAKWTIAPETAR